MAKLPRQNRERIWVHPIFFPGGRKVYHVPGVPLRIVRQGTNRGYDQPVGEVEMQPIQAIVHNRNPHGV